MNATFRNSIAAFSVASLAVVSAAQASIVVSDNFSSDTAGASLTSSGGGGTGWAGDWFATSGGKAGTITTGPISAPSGTTVSPTGNSVQFSSPSSTVGEDERNFASAITTTTTQSLSGTNVLYFSFLTQRNTAAANNYSLIFFEGTGAGASGGNSFAVGTGGGSNGDWLIDNGSAGKVADSGVASGTGATFIVGSIDLSTSQVEIYINPQGSSQPATASATYTPTASAATMTGIIPYVSGGNITSFSDIVFGSTYADVVANVVPEPTSLALMCVPAMALLRRRRRHSA